MKLTINELLLNRGIKSSDKVKFVRHKDNRKTKTIDGKEYNVSLYDLYRQGSTKDVFLRYQSEQSDNVFDGVNYIVSFIGEDGQKSRFIGVYKIVNNDKPCNCSSNFFYKMKEESGFEDLKERVIVDWGKATISWHQWMNNDNQKIIVEIGMPLNHVQFKNYYDFILDRSQFELIFKKEFSEWKKALSAINCIYLITDKNTGKQYVGSTYGKSGVWGRWSGYFKTIHNDNTELIKLTDNDLNYKDNFQYTILQVLPINVTNKEAIDYETLYKNKLGSRAFGLNCN